MEDNFNIFDNNKEFNKLYEEWQKDIKEELPNKSYKGNCTKEFCDKIIDIYIDREYERMKNVDFPPMIEKEISDKSCINDFDSLVKKDLSYKTLSRIIKKFHKSIIYANIENTLSPYDGWQKIIENKESFRKFYANRLRCSDWFKEKSNWRYLLQGYVPDFIYGIGLSTSRAYPTVSYFKPALAKYIIKKYLNEYDTVFDPFSGYSGRMLGTIALGKNYIGQDLCESSVNESREILNFIKPLLSKYFNEIPTCELSIKDSTQESGKYECLFTCPPYAKKEQWPGVEVVDYDCDKWIDICLQQYDCEKYVFVVDNLIEKYKPFVVEEIENTSHFGSNIEYIICIENEKAKELIKTNKPNTLYTFQQMDNNITYGAHILCDSNFEQAQYTNKKSYISNYGLVPFMVYLYNIFNKEHFANYIECPSAFVNWIKLIYDSFKQEHPTFGINDDIIQITNNINNENNKVVLGFSGGLDSVYQLQKLLDSDYDVIPFHIANINKYENGQARKASKTICDKLNLSMFELNFHSVNNGENKKFWPENPIKNQLILAYIIEYCLDNNISKFSLGDPFNLPIIDATAGINLTDANEITEGFIDIIKNNYYNNLEFIPILDYVDKIQEFDYLQEHDLENDYYSCIGAGRFNQFHHNEDEKRYNIKLEKNNCGTYCRKCATINLLKYYDRNYKYPQSFIDKCWNRLWNNGFSSEFFQFNESIPLEQRIKNLHTT